jgi:MFS family permease
MKRFAPLRESGFRRIWSASLISNFGQMILGVGAAWQMTQLTASASMIALVQTAMMFPLMLIAVPAGALADMFDRRKIAMAGLGFASLSSVFLTVLASAGFVTPWTLLVFCALIGSGVALYGPAWQASIGEQVSADHLPAAVALGSISYNFARSFGPALGGMIVALAGARAAFAVNAACYVPFFLAFLLWQRRHGPSRLPPERIDRAIISGARYAVHSVAVRTVIVRAFAFGMVGASATALAPLIARQLLHGNAATLGLQLGATGVGAVLGLLMVADFRERFGAERTVRFFAILAGMSLIVVGLSHNIFLTCILLALIGAANVTTVALLNITVQMSVPRWVTARALSLFQSATTGGIGFGAIVWGIVALHWGVSTAMAISGGLLSATSLLGLILRLPASASAAVEVVVVRNELNVSLDLSLRSGPVEIEIEYIVAPEQARAFYDAMRVVQRLRQRNGGFAWSLARDIADPALWTERYECPTWGDYLRARERLTQADQAALAAAEAFHAGEGTKRIRRRLVRPFGSVRWKSDSLDLHHDSLGPIST